MALDTYAHLQTAIGDFLNRADLTTPIPDFIAIAEFQMRRRFKMALNEGKTLPRKMVTQSASFTITAATELVSVPTDFLGVLSFTIDAPPNSNTTQAQLDYISPQNLAWLKQRRGPNPTNATPGAFSIVGSKFQFLPIPDITYTGDLWYWQDFVPLATSPNTNWIFTDHPDAYLYGALVAASPYLMDDARIPVWGNLFTQAIEDIIASDPLPTDRTTLRMDSGLTFRPRMNTWNITTGDFIFGP